MIATAAFVSDSVPTASVTADTGIHVYHPGDASAPSGAFRSIRVALNRLKAGQTLYVHEGVYDESFRGTDFPSGQSWDRPITMKAVGEVIIRPNTAADRVMTFDQPSAHHIIIDGFVLDATNVQYDAVKITSGSSGAAHHIWFRNTVIKNASAAGILTTDGADHNRFTNVEIENNGSRRRHEVGATNQPFSHGIYLSSSHNVVEDSSVHDNFGWGIHVFSSKEVTTGNIVRNNAVYSNGLSGRGVGIGLYRSRDFEALGNLVFDHPQVGIGYGYGTTNGKIARNVVYNHPGIGTEISVTASHADSGTRLSDNTIIGARDAPAVLPTSGNASFISAFMDSENTSQTVSVMADRVDSGGQVALTLYVSDPDAPNEGTLSINGRGELNLFGQAASASANGKEVKVTLQTPSSWWNNGENELVFQRRSSAYHVFAIDLSTGQGSGSEGQRDFLAPTVNVPSPSPPKTEPPPPEPPKVVTPPSPPPAPPVPSPAQPTTGGSDANSDSGSGEPGLGRRQRVVEDGRRSRVPEPVVVETESEGRRSRTETTSTRRIRGG